MIDLVRFEFLVARAIAALDGDTPEHERQYVDAVSEITRDATMAEAAEFWARVDRSHWMHDAKPSWATGREAPR